MPIDPFTASLIGKGVSTAVGFGASAMDYKHQQKLIDQQNRANQMLAGQQRDWNLEQWNRQNAYNDPAAQMGRLTKAGLNPNLLYGQGVKGATGAAGAVQPYNRATAESVKGAQIFQGGLQSRNLNAQTNNIEANTQYTLEKKQTEQLSQVIKSIQGKSDKEQYKILSQISDSMVDKYIADTQRSKVSATFLENTLTAREEKLQEEIKGLKKLNNIREIEGKLKGLMRDKESFYKSIYSDPQLQADLKKLIPQLTQGSSKALQTMFDFFETMGHLFGGTNPLYPFK